MLTSCNGSESQSFVTTAQQAAAPTIAKPALTNSNLLARVLYAFHGVDGERPFYGVLVNDSGSIYGAADATFPRAGVVYRLTQSGRFGPYSETILHTFSGLRGDGSGPNGLLVMATDGTLFGTTVDGGLTSDSSGALYGTTQYGGSNNNGVVFKLTPSGSSFRESVLYHFQNRHDGRTPQYGVTVGASGTLFGVAVGGCCGIVYELVPSGGRYKARTIHTFSEFGDGQGPSSSLLMSNGGVFYGETAAGGLLQGGGTIYKLTPRQGPYGESLLHTFSGREDGKGPTGGLTLFNRQLYGVTTEGGYVQNPDCPVGCGTVFSLSL